MTIDFSLVEPSGASDTVSDLTPNFLTGSGSLKLPYERLRSPNCPVFSHSEIRPAIWSIPCFLTILCDLLCLRSKAAILFLGEDLPLLFFSKQFEVYGFKRPPNQPKSGLGMYW